MGWERGNLYEKKFETNEKVDIVKHSLQYGLRLFVHDLHFYRMGWFFYVVCTLLIWQFGISHLFCIEDRNYCMCIMDIKHTRFVAFCYDKCYYFSRTMIRPT